MTNTIPFDDIFHGLIHDLETDANDWNLNHFYLHFDDGDDDDDDSNIPDHQYSSSQTKSRSTKEINHFYQVPDHLSASSSSFRVTFMSELYQCLYANDFIQDLQQLIFLTYQMSIIHLHQQLWHRFLQCGTGQLKQPPFLSSISNIDLTTTISFWPEIVTSVMISQSILDAHRSLDQIIDSNIYIHFIQNYLHQLDKKLKQCQLQFNTIKKRRTDCSIDIDNDKIEHFVQTENSLIAMRLFIQIRIILMDAIYFDRCCQSAYVQQKPTNLQLLMVKQMSSLILEKETTQQEMILFKFGLLFRKLPKSLDLLEVSLPTTITTLSDPIIRERLSNEYQRIIQRAKADLLMILTTASEAKRNDCQHKFDSQLVEIWKNQRQLPTNERLTNVMLTLIEQRQKNITECVKRIYHLKGNLFHKVAPPPPSLTYEQ